MLVLATFAIIMLLMVAGVAIDLGTAYAGGRQMQNAADASAVAGAEELECYLFAPAGPTPPGVGCQVPGSQTAPITPADIGSVVSQVAEDNGVSSSTSISCDIIGPYSASARSPGYQVIKSCAAWNGSDSSVPPPAGVAVEVGATQVTFFGGITGTRTTSEHRIAAATIQPATGLGSLFLACAYGGGNPALLTPLAAPPTTGVAYLPLQDPSSPFFPAPPSTPDYSSWNANLYGYGTAPGLDPLPGGALPSGYEANSGAIYQPPSPQNPTGGPSYLLWGQSATSPCGLHSEAHKGRIDLNSFPLPAEEPINTGTAAGQVNPTLVADECLLDNSGKSIASGVGCVLIVPIAVSSNGLSGGNGYLWCVGFGEFKYLGGAENNATFGFLGLEPNATLGQTSGGGPQPQGVNIVRLVQ